VRLYLHLCFFHPFANGNARAARLWFDYLLRRGGYEIAFVEPLFVVERFAGDFVGYIDFLRLAVLSCERAQQRRSRELHGECARGVNHLLQPTRPTACGSRFEIHAIERAPEKRESGCT
jgi:hypothetical protein